MKILRIKRKRAVTAKKITEQEWESFKKITAYCKDTSHTIGLDLLTLAENNHIVALNLSGQALKFLPPAIEHFHYLKQLLLIENKLTSLPAEIQSLNRLEILYLDKNPLKTVPKELLNLKSLQQLSLGETSLSEIPPMIDRLGQLTHLWLNDNALGSLPSALSRLTKLQRVDLRGNSQLGSKNARNLTGKELIDFLASLQQE
ncbi:MAG: leucine-rich repeat domain-containing protein [Candidatus Hodarchaeota archaeon]